MKIVLTVILVSVLMMVAAPAYAAEATQMWKCEMEDGVSEAEVTAVGLQRRWDIRASDLRDT